MKRLFVHELAGSVVLILLVMGPSTGCESDGGESPSGFVSLAGNDGAICAQWFNGRVFCSAIGEAQNSLVSEECPAQPMIDFTISDRNEAWGILAEGGFVHWGSTTWYGTEHEPSETDFKKIEAGYDFLCALRENGAVVCWGAVLECDAGDEDCTARGKVSYPGPYDAFSVDSGYRGFNVCLSGTESPGHCVWDEQEGEFVQPERHNAALGGDGFVQMEGSMFGGCGLDSAGTIGCWDSLEGLTEWGIASVRTGDAPAGEFSKVSAQSDNPSPSSGCAIGVNGELVSWGESRSQEQPEGPFKDIVSAGGATFLIRENGELVVWGETALDPPSIPASSSDVTPAGYLLTCSDNRPGYKMCIHYTFDDEDDRDSYYVQCAGFSSRKKDKHNCPDGSVGGGYCTHSEGGRQADTFSYNDDFASEIASLCVANDGTWHRN